MAVLLPLLVAALASGAVVINEIHYNPGPAEDDTVEFMELTNLTDQAVDLSGWRLSEAVTFRFPDGASIGPSGFVVVCRNVDRLTAHFTLDGEGVYGDFAGKLDDGGARIFLRDAQDRVLDAVSYHDEAPWPPEADGTGASCQRICPTAIAYRGSSWIGHDPTPGTANHGLTCPPPSSAPGDVVITEINYHPLRDRDRDEEFVEIHNKSGLIKDMGGWEVRGGIQYAFPEGCILLPGTYVLVCRNGEAARQVFTADIILGNYQGRLSNQRDLVALYNAAGGIEDAVFYDSEDPWPAAPDGAGFSLERISLNAPGEDPANWATAWSEALDGFVEVTAESDRVLPGQRTLVLYLEGEGESLLDDVVLEDITDPGAPTVVDQWDFDAGLTGWTISPKTPYGDSTWAEGDGVARSGALRLIANRSCHGACSTHETVRRETQPLSGTARYRLRMKFKHVRGAASVVASIDDRLVLVSAPSGIHSAGRENGVNAAEPLPFVIGTGRDPAEPRSTDEPIITASIQSPVPLARVFIRSIEGDDTPNEHELFDDGQHHDRGAGDGIWGAGSPRCRTIRFFSIPW